MVNGVPKRKKGYSFTARVRLPAVTGGGSITRLQVFARVAPTLPEGAPPTSDGTQQVWGVGGVFLFPTTGSCSMNIHTLRLHRW